jgi:hypothetical protein
MKNNFFVRILRQAQDERRERLNEYLPINSLRHHDGQRKEEFFSSVRPELVEGYELFLIMDVK